MTDELRSGVLEGARVVVLALVAWLIVEGVELLFSGISLEPTVKSFIVGAILTALKALDKYLHSVGKYREDDTLVTGITRF